MNVRATACRSSPSASSIPSGRSSRRASLWALCAWALAVFAVLVDVGCPDPCALVGGCNSTADCPRGEVCRLPRDGEPGCPVVAGTCLADDGRREATLCGSVDDCAAGECCDPRWNRCVRDHLYLGPSCDARTCRDCAAADLRVACAGRNDCPDGQLCDGALDTDPGLCGRRCSSDDDCAGDQRCSLDVCTVGLGKPCLTDEERGLGSVPQQDRCKGLRCVATDAVGDRVDPYCTDLCRSEFEGEICPADRFACVDDLCMLR